MPQLTRNPTSDVAVTGTWSGTVGSRYTLVDDFPSQDTADALVHGTAAGNILFGFTPFDIPAGSTGISINVRYYDREAISGVNNLGPRIRVGGNDYSESTQNPGTSTTFRSYWWYSNPKTNTSWTVDDINGIGANAISAFGVYSTDASPLITITSIQLIVSYTPPPITLEQSEYGFYSAGTETGSVIKGPQTTPLTYVKGTDPNIDVRVLMQETSGNNFDVESGERLQYRRNGGNWIFVGEAESQNYYTFSSNVTSTYDVTQYITSPFNGQLSFALNVAGFIMNPVDWQVRDSSNNILDSGSTFAFGSFISVGTSAILTQGQNYSIYLLFNTFLGIYTTLSDSVFTSSSLGFEVLGGLTISTLSPVYVNFNSSTSMTHNQSTTNRLTGGTGTFIPGKVYTTQYSNQTTVLYTANNFSEHVEPITINDNALESGDYLEFQLVRNGPGTFVYSVYPRIDIQLASNSEMFMLF